MKRRLNPWSISLSEGTRRKRITRIRAFSESYDSPVRFVRLTCLFLPGGAVNALLDRKKRPMNKWLFLMGVVFMFLPASGQVGVNFYENIPGFTVGESGDSIALTSEGGIPAGDTAEVFSFPATPAQVYTLQLDARNA